MSDHEPMICRCVMTPFERKYRSWSVNGTTFAFTCGTCGGEPSKDEWRKIAESIPAILQSAALFRGRGRIG